ncbi:hypothetical protein ACFWFZ_10760 [Streptomyces sp. NPDC060232]|uniref:hypothetical protein n=1 Tax=Streptomyces sp. NPDC060232 TaxID=3347079 RepID=UPI0036584401
MLIDDFDEGGTITVLTSPDPEAAVYADEVRAAYTAGVTLSDGPAKGFAIGEDVTGPGRAR